MSRCCANKLPDSRGGGGIIELIDVKADLTCKSYSGRNSNDVERIIVIFVMMVDCRINRIEGNDKVGESFRRNNVMCRTALPGIATKEREYM